VSRLYTLWRIDGGRMSESGAKKVSEDTLDGLCRLSHEYGGNVEERNTYPPF
jgi:hypothetical protein